MTSLHLKPGVDARGITPVVNLIITVALQVWDTYGLPQLWVTSLTDGKHMPGSKHHTGEAVDLRTRDLPPGVAVKAMLLMCARLGAQFDVVLEADHIHVEFDPA